MIQPTRSEDTAALGLEEISALAANGDPMQFVLRYAPAIRKYLESLLKNSHDAEEVAQEFLLKGILRGFVLTTQLRGKFRYYLKTAVRNAALTHLPRRRPDSAGGVDPGQFADAQDEQPWLAEWRGCVIDRALQALDHHQQQTPGNLFYTVVRLSLDHPEEDSVPLAAQGRYPGRPHAAGRRLSQAIEPGAPPLAELLTAEVARTLDQPTPERIEEELCELGLLTFVPPFLQRTTRTRCANLRGRDLLPGNQDCSQA